MLAVEYFINAIGSDSLLPEYVPGVRRFFIVPAGRVPLKATW